tara:strand:+ start:299 stop:430 length:132 start_codon:yes stop_codon:yes gene_type:complete
MYLTGTPPDVGQDSIETLIDLPVLSAAKIIEYQAFLASESNLK